MANTRERVKDFPSIVGTIQSDDYIPVDGATQGVRKAQVKDIMDAPITGLDTIANTTKGAINELATTAGKVWVGTQDEYDDLPDSKLTDNVLHCITDGEPSAYDSIWDKVGTDPLDTTASDCSGAINELKQSLVNKQSSTVTNNGVSVRYLIRGGICTLSITGRPTTTNNLTFTIPKAYIGFHKTEPQWGDTSNLIQYWIDDSSTTLTIRNHSLNNLNASASYCPDFS